MSSEFWKQVLSWLKESNIVIESCNEIGLFLGIFEEMEDFFIINHVILFGKYYIYVRKCLGGLPSLRGFIARIDVFIILNSILRGRGINSLLISKNGKT